MIDLRGALEGLAATAEEQLERMPNGSVKTDELTLEFDDAVRYWWPRKSNEWSEEQ